MKKTKLVTSLVLVLVLTCCMMATSFAATKITYQCNGNDAGRYRTDSHSYGDGLNCDVMMRQSYCTQYINGAEQGDAHHKHNHMTYHTGCPAGMTYPCTHGSVHS